MCSDYRSHAINLSKMTIEFVKVSSLVLEYLKHFFIIDGSINLGDAMSLFY